MNNFKEYLKKLKMLKTENTLVNKEKIVILISGSSNYKNAALSEEQKNFLEIFRKYGYEIVDSNFPYNENFKNKDYENVNIIKASISNIIYYIHTLYNKEFQKEIVRHCSPFFNKEEVIVVSQSSGFNMLKILEKENLNKIKIFALGPVAKGKSKIGNTAVIKGKRDFYSRIMDFHKEDMLVNCGHFEYLIKDEVKEKICDIMYNEPCSGNL